MDYHTQELFLVRRPIDGVSINGYEYLLDDNNNPMVFGTVPLAVLFLQANGFGHLTDEQILEAFDIHSTKPQEPDDDQANQS